MKLEEKINRLTRLILVSTSIPTPMAPHRTQPPSFRGGAAPPSAASPSSAGNNHLSRPLSLLCVSCVSCVPADLLCDRHHVAQWHPVPCVQAGHVRRGWHEVSPPTTHN
jgi:hypothetical protein